MIELGKKDTLFGIDQLESYYGFRSQRPAQMPPFDNDKKLICGYDQGLGERMIVCEDIEDAQELYDAYARGGAVDIHWYVAPDPGFITVVTHGGGQ